MKISSNLYLLRILKKINLKRFLFFLAIAFLFLMLTKLSQTYTQKIDLKVEFTNLEDEIILVNDSLNIAEVTVKTKGFNLVRYLFTGQKVIQLDGKKTIQKKDDRLFWNTQSYKYTLAETYGNTLEVLSIVPDTLFFEYDELYLKKVPITFNHTIQYTRGYDVVEQLKLAPDSVNLVGSSKQLNTINSVETEFVNLTEIKTDIDLEVKLKALSNNIILKPKKVKIKGSFKQFTEGKFTVPITLINAPQGQSINFFPKAVDVIYYVDIASFSKVNSTDFTVICDFRQKSELSKDALELELTNTSPIVKRSKLSQHTVEYIITDL